MAQAVLGAITRIEYMQQLLCSPAQLQPATIGPNCLQQLQVLQPHGCAMWQHENYNKD